MRISIISANDDGYRTYYRSRYALDNVKESLRHALDNGVYVSLNLLHFPGFTDTEGEVSAWIEFLRRYPVNMIQLRNLNIDPDFFLNAMPETKGKVMGTRQFLQIIRQNFPDIVIGNFSHYVRT